MDPEADLPNIPNGTGWWVSVVLLLGWVLDKIWPKLKEWWQAKRDDQKADAKLHHEQRKTSIRLAEDEHKAELDQVRRESEFVIGQYKDLAVQVKAQLDALVKKFDELYGEHMECLKTSARMEGRIQQLEVAAKIGGKQ